MIKQIIAALSEMGVEVRSGKVRKLDFERAFGPVEAEVSKKELEDALNSASNDMRGALSRLLDLMADADPAGKILTISKENELHTELDELMAKVRPMAEEILKTCEASVSEAAGQPAGTDRTEKLYPKVEVRKGADRYIHKDPKQYPTEQLFHRAKLLFSVLAIRLKTGKPYGGTFTPIEMKEQDTEVLKKDLHANMAELKTREAPNEGFKRALEDLEKKIKLAKF